MNGEQMQATCFGALLLGFYLIYMTVGPGGDGVILSAFVGALAAFGGYKVGLKQAEVVQDGNSGR